MFLKFIAVNWSGDQLLIVKVEFHSKLGHVNGDVNKMN